MKSRKQQTRRNGKSLNARFGIATLTAFVIFGSAFSACVKYDPALFPSYDVLNPGPEVRKNPVGFVTWSESKQAFVVDWDIEPDRTAVYLIINKSMSIWVFELKEALKNERK